MSETATNGSASVGTLSGSRPDSLTQDWSGHTLDMFGALILVIGTVFIVQLLLRHLQQKTAGSSGHLRVIQALSIGTKERVMLVQVGVDQILMGVSAAGIKHLHTLTEPVEIAEEKKPSQQNSGFASTIRSITNKPGSEK